MRSRAQVFDHPMHPMLVAFPIGLWVTSFIFDLIGIASDKPGFWFVGFYAAIAGCVGAVLAALPGAIDWFSVVPPNSSAKKRGGIHALLNLTVLAIFIFVAAHRGSPDMKPDGISIVGSLIGVAILAYSGWLGGTLVYRNQIGVDHRYANAGQWRERTLDSFDRPVCHPNELGPGQMMLAIIEGERIAVGRCDTGIVAFSDHCTHRGGPLSDGALVGCTVQCPWHGSNFDVQTGRVVAGPAEEKIRIYEIDVRNNEVYVIPEREQTRKAA
jgi:uncharacterized membrane protein/nitrite reductase/ring-hydroxylating ferredoxin subunit